MFKCTSCNSIHKREIHALLCCPSIEEVDQANEEILQALSAELKKQLYYAKSITITESNPWMIRFDFFIPGVTDLTVKDFDISFIEVEFHSNNRSLESYVQGVVKVLEYRIDTECMGYGAVFPHQLNSNKDKVK